MAPYAFVTMLTSDPYLPGCLVTAHSIKQSEKDNAAQDFDLVCLITLDSVSVESIKALRKVYNLVISVDAISSSNKDELNLLGRQDLSGTITKIHIWRLVQYQKVIYVDADTLILKSISHLFQLPNEFSASPDTGWPDCFNSGLMVIQPNLDVFDRLYAFFFERGSWDGGDQGVLNDFFSSDDETFEDGTQRPTWNRLSFAYNVTPSAYYSYAPAYRRFGKNIFMIHFIGQEKPWHLLGKRQFKTQTQLASSTGLPPVDYDALLHKWFDVYERAYGPIKLSDSTYTEHDFAFPKYAAQWDSQKPSRYEPPSFDKLKQMFTRKTDSNLSSIPVLHGEVYEGGCEGSYMSMPLPGRPHRFLTQHGFETRDDKGKNREPSMSSSYESVPVSELPAAPCDDHPIESDTTPRHLEPSESPVDETSFPVQSTSVDMASTASNHEKSDSGSHHHQPWDATRSPPPNQGFQMSNPITKRYEAAWDQPVQHQAAQFFQPPPQAKGYIPPITHQDYSQITSSSPSLQSVKPIFPWEQTSRNWKTSRVFPEETEVPQNDESRSRMQSYNSDAFSDDAHLHQQDQQPSIDQANLTELYRNAWDEHPFIRRYANALAGSSNSSRVRSEGGTRESLVAQLAQTPHLERKSFLSGSHFDDPPSSNPEVSEAAATFRLRRDSETSSRDGDEEDVGSDDEGSEDGAETSRRALKIDAMPVILPGRPTGPMIAPRRPPLYHGNESVGSVSRVPTVRSIIIGVPIGVDQKTGAGEFESVQRRGLGRNNGLEIESESRPGSLASLPAPKPSRVFSPTTDTGSLKKSGLDALQKLVNEMENQKRLAAGSTPHGPN
ncbi:putative glycogenin [Melampsora larici-populina 98AG31]|uniref:glycogenin glucosyltransferase n=1 Tax=Melampsora larici-populina (strain 98AG31 / pathotype 3-4-7) TaxID=747676 RepID=F4RW21_MELLP|nr:putative glycogenin [Melampsora larici-populina 98AG31]EGG03486.1 putative glycogenin [Melampsora larici-populina 98AG31]